jgi:two-component system C4-dicarboxylate transport response regulator DctD
MMKPTLMLVEDIASVRQRLVQQLRDAFEIVAECDGADAAVVAYQKHRPQLVLLDLVLPQRSGIEVMRVFFSLGEPRAQVVILSGIQDESIALQALAEGASDFLQKPVDPKLLREVLLRFVTVETQNKALAP